MGMTLSPEQAKAFDLVMAWHKTPQQEFVLAGYAGAGKTTLAKTIAEEIGPGTMFCAYTGKAANVLREKDCMNAGTIHRSLYSLTDHDRDGVKSLHDAILHARKSGDFDSAEKFSDQLSDLRAQLRQPKYELNMNSKLCDAPLVIIDEFSMLSQELINDLRKVGKKILYLGDPFQLPPVKGECPLKPDFFITEIHRQALDSGIIRASKTVREGGTISFGHHGDFQYNPQKEVPSNEYTRADQIICGTNKTRHDWNRRFRMRKGYDETMLPQVGEKMICLKNNHVEGLFNGMIGLVTGEAKKKSNSVYTMDFDNNIGLNIWNGDVGGYAEKYDGYNKMHQRLDRFDYGYVITAHKSQGSEFDNVLVYNQPIGRGDDRKRWLYTSLTRAKKNCLLVEPS